MIIKVKKGDLYTYFKRIVNRLPKDIVYDYTEYFSKDHVIIEFTTKEYRTFEVINRFLEAVTPLLDERCGAKIYDMKEITTNDM